MTAARGGPLRQIATLPREVPMAHARWNVPSHLVEAARSVPGGVAWLEALPDVVDDLMARWRLAPGDGVLGEGACSWVAPVVRADGTPAVLKLALPHMEAEDEIAGLRFWDGDAMVRLLEADEAADALLLERCLPGRPLRTLPEATQDDVIAATLRRLWRPPPPGPFRPLAVMIEHWSAGTRAERGRWPDAVLVEEGLAVFADLARPAADDVLLATDLHAGNVLAAAREPWLAIDPKPFVGDRAYDATQHLLNGRERLRLQPERTVERLADLVAVDAERLRLWTFARLAAEPCPRWDEAHALARAVRGPGA
jgi:streptomycin 6-kinase